MTVTVGKNHLQTQKYSYSWRRDESDSSYKGTSDRIKVDKDEGYEVAYFITKFMNKHNLKNVSNVHEIEDALHHPDLSAVVYRDELIAAIEEKLGY